MPDRRVLPHRRTVTVRQLIQRARKLYRWDTLTTRRLK